jgi:hypothetical protein
MPSVVDIAADSVRRIHPCILVAKAQKKHALCVRAKTDCLRWDVHTLRRTMLPTWSLHQIGYSPGTGHQANTQLIDTREHTTSATAQV